VFYLELQNVSGAVGAPMQIYFDPGRGLQCEVLDSHGKPPPLVGGAGSGGSAGTCWITLPYGSTIRLRASMVGYGKKPGDGLLIQLSPPSMQRWDIQSGDTNAYFMSGTFTVRNTLRSCCQKSRRDTLNLERNTGVAENETFTSEALIPIIRTARPQ
jgi:hypothetical protein